MAGKGKGQIVTRTGLADVFGVSLPTIDGWIRAGCPFEKRGGRGVEWAFDTAAVSRWLRDRAIEEATGETQADETELKRRKLSAETAKAELDLAKAKELVAPLDQVERNLSRVFAEVRANLRNLPSRTVSLLIGETNERRFKEVMLQEIDQVLVSLADMDILAPDDEDEDDSQAEE